MKIQPSIVVLGLAHVIGFGCASATPPTTGAGLNPDLADTRTAFSKSVIVTLATDLDMSLQRTRADLAEEFDLVSLYAWPLESIDLHCVVFEIDDDRQPQEVAEALAADRRIESAQPVQSFTQQSSSYDDPHYELQHGLQHLRVENLHQWSTGRGVRVAVVDTGIDAGHPDLQDSLVSSQRFIRPRETKGRVHGTAVAGIIAASANNKLGVVGVAPDAELISLQACVERELGAPGLCDTFSLAKALDFAIMNEIQVLNLSFSGPADPLLRRLIRQAIRREIIVVAAMNEGRSEMGFPASMTDVIAVGTTNLQGALELESSQAGFAALAAPGVDILTTVPGGGYDFLSGSSFAAAHVSGIAALVLQRRPTITPERLLAVLRSTGHPSSAHDGAIVAEMRRVDPCAALSDLDLQVSCPSDPLQTSSGN